MAVLKNAACNTYNEHEKHGDSNNSRKRQQDRPVNVNTELNKPSLPLSHSQISSDV
jgi:hypothetical protein